MKKMFLAPLVSTASGALVVGGVSHPIPYGHSCECSKLFSGRPDQTRPESWPGQVQCNARDARASQNMRMSKSMGIFFFEQWPSVAGEPVV